MICFCKKQLHKAITIKGSPFFKCECGLLYNLGETEESEGFTDVILLWKRLDFYCWDLMSSNKEKFLLDIETQGYFLRFAQSVGFKWNVFGSQSRKAKVKELERKFGLRDLFSNTSSLKRENFFDLIVLNDILGMEMDIRKFLIDLKKLVKVDGFLVFVVPVYDGFNLSEWPYLKNRRVLFNYKSLKRVLSEFFEVEVEEDLGSSFLLFICRPKT